MSDQERERAWKYNGKGNGLRWLILRDAVAGVSLYGMPLEKIQDYLLMLRGISWNTSRTMIKELERLEAVSSEQAENHVWYWTATKKGVAIFCRTRKHIPARIAQAVRTTMNVKDGEG